MKKNPNRNPNSKSAQRKAAGYYQQRYQHDSTLAAFRQKQFLAWDGEGANINDVHQYIMMRNSQGRALENPLGLSTLEVFRYLEWASVPGVINVIYGGSYDVNMILRDIPREEITRLWKFKQCDWGEYEISYRHRKEFTIQRFNGKVIKDGKPSYMPHHWRKDKDGTWVKHPDWSFRLWDVIGFFQGTFVQAIKAWMPDIPREELDDIVAHKMARDTFHVNAMKDIASYCRKEVEILQTIMERLRDALADAGLPVRRWDGAGAIAAELLRREGIKKYQAVQPNHIRVLAKHAYAGGRIEMLQYGVHHGKTYRYDIRSAYPAAMLNLPSLQAGRWVEVSGFQAGSFGLWEVRYSSAGIKRKLNPFFYRLEDGRIFYPAIAYGIYWTPEVEAALETVPENTQVIRGWVWHPVDPSERPFSFVKTIYELRAKLKKEGHASEKVLKLGLNSLYGKLAQQVSYKGRVPPFHQLEWAGYITSLTRANLYRAAAQKPSKVVHLATDGIVSTSPLDLEEGTELGQWEKLELGGVIEVQAGVYWLLDKHGGIYELHYRGYDRNELQIDRVIKHWESKDDSYLAHVTRFVTMGRAITSDKQWEKWRTWDTAKRSLAIDCGYYRGFKRIDGRNWRRDNGKTPDKGLVDTIPGILPDGCIDILSSPHLLAFEGNVREFFRDELQEVPAKQLDSDESESFL